MEEYSDFLVEVDSIALPVDVYELKIKQFLEILLTIDDQGKMVERENVA